MSDTTPPEIKGNKLSQLRTLITKLSRERDGLMNDILKDRATIGDLESELSKYQMEFEYLSTEIKEKEHVVLEYDRMINEGQKTFDRLEENSFKLIKALQEEEKKISNKYLKKI